MNNLIETQALSFSFGKQEILQEIDLRVPKNCIYGFLGPNGAGKSTTIKILLGLLQIPKEKAFLFGEDIRTKRLAILSRIGNLIESPSIYGHLSAFDNLRIVQTLFSGPKNRIDEVLELVGLQHAKHKKAKRFSMGMKQRLGIGMALFHDPELIIVGFLLTFFGKRVVYDVHEDFPVQVMAKEYMPVLLRKFISKGFVFLEWLTIWRFS